MEMFGPDLSAAVDPEPFARFLATPTFDVAACRRAIEAFLRTNTANIHDITRAFKAFVGKRLVDHKPRMIELLSYTHDGAFSADLGERIHRIFGHPMWNASDDTHLLDTTRRL